MTKAEEFIKEQTQRCSNERDRVEHKGTKTARCYRPWITPKQALKAIGIAKEEFIEQACEWLKFNLQDYAGEDSFRNSVPFDKDVFDAFRKAMKE